MGPQFVQRELQYSKQSSSQVTTAEINVSFKMKDLRGGEKKAEPKKEEPKEEEKAPAKGKRKKGKRR